MRRMLRGFARNDNGLTGSAGASLNRLMTMTDAMPDDVAAAFDKIPERPRDALLAARACILAAAEARQVGPVTETLRWGEPAYLTEKSKSGSTIRLGLENGRPAAFFICTTSLVDGFRSDFPDAFEYVGNRALILSHLFDANALGICLGRALTYHRDKSRT